MSTRSDDPMEPGATGSSTVPHPRTDTLDAPEMPERTRPSGMTSADIRKAVSIAALAGAALLAIGAGTGYVASQQLRPLEIATDRSLLQDVPPTSAPARGTTDDHPTTSAAPTTSRSTTRSAPPTQPAVLPLAKRITRTTVALPARLSYLEPGYNMLPQWRRIDTARAPGGTVYVAWQGPDGVHVTTLSSGLTRTGPDTVISNAVEIGGLVAHDDGFALLTRKPDHNKWDETAAHLIRFRDGRRIFDAALTDEDGDHDSTPVLGGQLRWDGSRYGAYFIVHGAGGFADGHFGDKLMYVDDDGRRLQGGWNWGCSHNEGTALLPRAGKDFASLCFEDWRSGLFVSTGVGAPGDAPVISREECWAGYCGGNFGGFVALPGGRYAVAFSTRGATSVVPDGTGRGFKVTAKYETHQVALAFLSNASTPDGRPIPIATDPDVDHINVRLAPYGKDRLLLSYETVTAPSCKAGTCTGRFSGTHLQLLDLDGDPLGASITVRDRFAGDIAVLPDGDLAWAYAAVTPSYTKALSDKSTVTKLTVARLDLQPGG
jgi:hypothetical protein